MRSSLLIRLQTNKTDVSWAIFAPTGQLIESATHVSLDTIPHHDNPPFVLIPGTDVLLTQANIPTKQWRRIVQAVPYTLEEQLADDVENLHFALGKRESVSGNVTVAVIAHFKMDAYLQQLGAAGLIPAILMPDILAVPKPDDGWGMLYIDDLVLIRTDLYSGFAIELNYLNTTLQLALAEHEDNPPKTITVFTGTQPNTALIELQALGIPIIEKTHEKGIFAWLAQGLIEDKPLNLLQNNYLPQDKATILLRPWRLTIVLLIILGGLYLAQQKLEYQQLSQQRQALNAQIEKIYRETFPQARKIVNPRVQMEQKLKALRARQTMPKNHFLSLLNKISLPLTRTPSFNLKRLDYRQGYFEIQLEVANLQALEYLKKRLSSKGLNVEIQSAISRNNLVKSRLRISEP